MNVTLSNEDLWMQRFPFMEMNCRRQTPLFPELKFTITGLEERKMYKVMLTIEREGSTRFTYDKDLCKWKESETRNVLPVHEFRQIEHISGAQDGSYWMVEPVEFNKVKICSKEEDATLDNVFFTQPHHKYKPVITIKDVATNEDHKFGMTNATFLPVTVYKDVTMGAWKAGLNKYATKKNGGVGGGRKRNVAPSDDGQAKKKTKLASIPAVTAVPVAPLSNAPAPFALAPVAPAPTTPAPGLQCHQHTSIPPTHMTAMAVAPVWNAPAPVPFAPLAPTPASPVPTQYPHYGFANDFNHFNHPNVQFPMVPDPANDFQLYHHQQVFAHPAQYPVYNNNPVNFDQMPVVHFDYQNYVPPNFYYH